MSKYTTTIRMLLENGFELALDDYPIFDENYRKTLNKKIIDHFYFREIGFETAGLFNFYLKRTMNEIMPFYNQLYNSQLIKFNPLYNVEKTETFLADRKTDTINNQDSQSDTTAETKSNTTSTDNNTSLANNKNVSSDTPQGKASVISIDDNTWATNATLSKNDVKNTGQSNSDTNANATTGQNTSVTATANIKNLEEYSRKVIGKSEGESFSKMLLQFRDTFLNIDMQVIAELETLFMLIY